MGYATQHVTRAIADSDGKRPRAIQYAASCCNAFHHIT